MGAGVNYKITAYKSSAIDLTSTATNADAAPQTTARQGGFTLRNRWNCANLATANKTTYTAHLSASKSSVSRSSNANLFYVLSVPKRTLIKKVQVYGVDSGAIPQHAVASAATAASVDSMGAAWALCFNAKMYQTAAQAASAMDDTWQSSSEVNHPYAAASLKSSVMGNVFGGLNLAKWDASGGAFDTLNTFEKIDATISVPNQGGQNPVWNDGGVMYAPVHPVYFPYGGYVTMGLGPLSVAGGATASSDDGADVVGLIGTMSGVWEVQADCHYVPE